MSRTRTSLLNRIKDPEDALSWEEFDRVYRPLLLRYALARGVGREEAEDVAQQCMVAISSGIQDFQKQVGFRGWLRGMIDHKVSDQLRKQQHEVKGQTADFDREQTTEESPVLVWERQWNQTHLLYCLNEVRRDVAPMTYRAFDLYVLQEKPVKDICERLGMTPNQVYVAKSRVLVRLKKRWLELADGLI